MGQAFVAAEDRRFYQRDGVGVIGVGGAIRDNIVRGFGSRGASTTARQLVGAMFPDLVDRREITLSRKLREGDPAQALERRHPKVEILFGRGRYGVETAARHRVGKRAADYRVAEAALLAALPKSPRG